LLLRWFWWRINAWSEIAAMAASLPVLLLRPYALEWLGLPAATLPQLLFMVLGTACVWLPVTLLTAPVEASTLRRFYDTVGPPGWWGAVGERRRDDAGWASSLRRWLVGSVALLASTIGPLDIWLGRPMAGWAWCGLAVVGWWLSLSEVLRPPARRRSSP
jgi:hypothetical protein